MTASSPVPAASATERRLASLDIFRGACALSVFLTHWFIWANFVPQGDAAKVLHAGLSAVYDVFCKLTWSSGGHHPAVLGFFVLSGFCIHASRARRPASGAPAPGWRSYFLSRGRRILPVYWWGTLLGLGFVGLQVALPSPNPMLGIHASGGGRDLAVRALALTALVPGDVRLGNWTLNTVSTEITLYMLYPLLFWLTRRAGWLLTLAGLVVLQFVAMIVAGQMSPYWLINTPLLMGAHWYLGMLAAEWHFNRTRDLPPWVPVLCWGLFLALRETPDFYGHYEIVQLVRSLGFVALLLWLVQRELARPNFGRSWLSRSLRNVGQASYSLYAVHTPVIMATTWALGTLGFRQQLLQLLVSMLTTVIVTVVTYRFVERPFLRQRARDSGPVLAPFQDKAVAG